MYSRTATDTIAVSDSVATNYPTTLAVSVDLEEYSRFEIAEGRATINVTIIASGGGNMYGRELTVDLYKARRLRDQTIYTDTITIDSTDDPATVTTSIYLPDVRDDNVSLIRRGQFFVRATVAATPLVTDDSADFPISILTAQQLRKTWLFGLPMDAFFMRDVRLQPSVITGVTVEEVSGTHPTGFKTLNLQYVSSGKYLMSWAGGPLVSVQAAGQYLLSGSCGVEFILVQIRSMADLPTSNQVEDLLVVKSPISNAMLRRWIDGACDWLENDKIAGVYLEPTRVTTDPLQSGVTVDWDFITCPVTYYPPSQSRWIDIQFPFPGLISFDRLWGQMGATQVVEVVLQWVEIAEKSGFVQLVPYNATMAFQFIGLIWVESLRGRIELPGFWHYTAIAGLREVDPVLIEVIGKKAAIDALTVAGQAFRGGYSSQSLSRDGVSESVSYTASAIYGFYSASIEAFDKFINREIKQLKGKYRGPGMVVM